MKNTVAGGAGSGGAGNPKPTYTMDDLKGMTPEQINKNWENIKNSLEKAWRMIAVWN